MKGITGHSALEAYRRASLDPVSPARPAEAPAAGAGERHPTEAAKLSISTEARELWAKGEAQVDRKKVEALKASIADGSFRIDARLVAGRMLDSAG